MRWVDTNAARPRWRFNVAYRVLPRLSLGLEYNPAVGEINPTMNWIAHVETHKVPLVSFGTSSDRIFTPRDNRAYFLTFAKSVPGLPIAPYISINYSEYENGFNIPFGVNVSLSEEWDLLPMNDGRKTHLLLTRKFERSNLTFMLIDLKRPKIGFSLGFGL